jgi:hypothetical protein
MMALFVRDFERLGDRPSLKKKKKSRGKEILVHEIS